MGDTAFTLDVRIRDIDPPIWRSIELSGTSTLEDLHYAIQTAMGWTNSHLHQFTIGNKHYGSPQMDDVGHAIVDERGVRIADVLGPRAACVYEYDFGGEEAAGPEGIQAAGEGVRPVAGGDGDG